MSFFGDIANAVGSAVTAGENLLGQGVKLAEQVAPLALPIVAPELGAFSPIVSGLLGAAGGGAPAGALGGLGGISSLLPNLLQGLTGGASAGASGAASGLGGIFSNLQNILQGLTGGGSGSATGSSGTGGLPDANSFLNSQLADAIKQFGLQQEVSKIKNLIDTLSSMLKAFTDMNSEMARNMA